MPEYEATIENVDLNQLKVEINNSEDISVDCEFLKHEGPDSLYMYFGEELTTQEQSDLSTIVANHVPPTHVKRIEMFKIQECDKTAGMYMKHGNQFSIPASVQEHVNTISLPFTADALAIRAAVDIPEFGDYISIEIGKDSVIGLVDNSGGYASGAKVIKVDQSVFDYIQVGKIVRFGSDSNKYWVADIDKENSTITIWRFRSTDDGLINAINDNDYVKMTTLMIDKEYFDNKFPIITGDSKIGGSGIPANTEVNIVFFNSTATAKKLNFNTALLYGKT